MLESATTVTSRDTRIIKALSCASRTSGCTQPPLRIETIDAEKQPIGIQPAQHLLRLRADGRRGHLPQDAANHDHADMRQRSQFHRDVERVGDDRERFQLEEL